MNIWGVISHVNTTIGLLGLLWLSMLGLLIYYGLFLRWRKSPAGKSFFYLLSSMFVLVSFLLISRIIDDLDLRRSIYNVLIVGLIGAFWVIIGVISHARAKYRKSRAQHHKEEEPSNGN
ncbi:holin [Arthrobacter phage Grekaycon]|uniref:Holin n=2 Tax=Marthavirus martha TaxID=1980950 RepID=A0A514A5H6_9CAUD|nr:holin [Arthrobacter phage TaeYoung]KUR65805.1 hypothetical protein JM67_03365 [Arthrobacter sp. ATCC 21022]QDH48517.1 holin [Arthrobacter phage Grekaycon]